MVAAHPQHWHESFLQPYRPAGRPCLAASGRLLLAVMRKAGRCPLLLAQGDPASGSSGRLARRCPVLLALG